MPTNMYMIFVAALIPFVLGALYYGPIFGKAWMKTNNFTEEYLKKGNMLVIFGVSYLFMVMFSFIMTNMVIHQAGIYGLLVPEVSDQSSQVYADAKAFMDTYGDRHRNFGHGAVHGVFFAIFFILPVIGVNALFERRSWKYIFIHFGYWLLSAVLVGGLLCATIEFPPL